MTCNVAAKGKNNLTAHLTHSSVLLWAIEHATVHFCMHNKSILPPLSSLHVTLSSLHVICMVKLSRLSVQNLHFGQINIHRLLTFITPYVVQSAWKQGFTSPTEDRLPWQSADHMICIQTAEYICLRCYGYWVYTVAMATGYTQWCRRAGREETMLLGHSMAAE